MFLNSSTFASPSELICVGTQSADLINTSLAGHHQIEERVKNEREAISLTSEFTRWCVYIKWGQAGSTEMACVDDLGSSEISLERWRFSRLLESNQKHCTYSLHIQYSILYCILEFPGSDLGERIDCNY
jgi:hypothetical protein